MKFEINEETGIIQYPFGDKVYPFDLMKVCCKLAEIEKESGDDRGALCDAVSDVMTGMGMPEPTYTQAEVFYAVVAGATEQLKKALGQRLKGMLDLPIGTESIPPAGPKSRKSSGKKALSLTGQKER